MIFDIMIFDFMIRFEPECIYKIIYLFLFKTEQLYLLGTIFSLKGNTSV